MPPRITPRFIFEALCNPSWTIHTLAAGLPKLRIMEKYARSANMATTAAFVGRQIGGTLSWDCLKVIRDEWQGPLIAKGIQHPIDAETAIEIGCDGIQVSNHGARQFDAAPAAIDELRSSSGDRRFALTWKWGRPRDLRRPSPPARINPATLG